MSPFELTTFVTVLANTIAAECPADDQALLAALFTQLGDTLATLSILSAPAQD
ncbi:DUF6774 domain-containing protein [Bacilliculturomica massiliensis]|uniref:DUF6774 domain-containing protein n=1 Tax=Bacilliculturomica massiliensis TaxID=1917867 RepID=UPI0013EF29AC|nr:DUF6774 domain-containing protein [Bacilliculturomica massiliensis]